ncbi:unnamed protein product [Rhizophagus irregularis]|uniref:Uncharacterized protein n=1 Tax=Rhizophagus irregularis TaxID=588596 RepID=A0A2I1E483_9GLOM|nr:kinase-like protein [Rhizophagus irregularis]CAB4467417.1 unnamed protein product [Rhizophagus irregularis]CAB5360290.1 unnamed protein product [Rhizophagus irregularis]
MNILNRNFPKITSGPDDDKAQYETAKKSKKFSLFKKSYKENGILIFKTTTEIVEKIVPELEVAIKLANIIIDIYERAKINREICRIMADRVELAMTSIRLLIRNKDENDEILHRKGYYKSVMRFNRVLGDIKGFIEEISGVKGFKKYVYANYIKGKFEEYRDEFDHAYKALQLAITIEQFVDSEKENKIIKKSLDDLNGCYKDVYKDMKENHNLVMEKLSVLATIIDNSKEMQNNSLVDNINPPKIDAKSILPHESIKHHGNIKLRRYNAQDVACKIIKFPIDGDTPESKKIRGMLAIWNQLKDCTHIIKFYGITKMDAEDYMIIEWAEFNNLKNVYENTKLSWQLKLFIARDIFRGLCFLHFIGILHHDVKAENILVTSGYKCKLSNFELSRAMGENSKEVTDPKSIIRWMAPEKLATYHSEREGSYVRYTDACEMFSFGMFLWELSFNRVPYNHIDKSDDIIEYVINGNRETLNFEKGPSDIIETFTEIITLAWKQDPRDRPQDPAVSAILGRTFFCESSPMSFYEQDNNDSTTTSLENSQSSNMENSIKMDEDYNIVFDDDDDDDLLPFNNVIELHNKPNKTEQDKKLAWEYFNAHAELGNKNALFWKAHYLSEGYYVEKDKKKAIPLFKEAADAGVAEAQYRYAMEFIKVNPDIFLDYLTQSAENGYILAMYNLGMCYTKGQHAPKNTDKGIEYLKIAALKGHEKAIDALKKLDITI